MYLRKPHCPSIIITETSRKMKLQSYPTDALTPFARLHNLKLNGISISDLGPDLGLGILFDPSKYDSLDPALLTIDKDLILSAESVELAGKSDSWIRDLLRACCGTCSKDEEQEEAQHNDRRIDLANFPLGESDDEEDKDITPWGRNPRLMIMLFLVVMMARGVSIEGNMKLNEQRKKGMGVGTGGIWSEYIKFLPSVSLPTTWTEEERALLKGTSIESAVAAKIASLTHEYHSLRRLTFKIPWCRQYLWSSNPLEVELTLSNWIEIDSWFRSRVLELPRIGMCLIPYLDMVNHSNEPNAYYQLTGDEGAVALLPIEESHEGDQSGNQIPLFKANEVVEVRINYGAHKSSAEQLFSYGFLDAEPRTCLWLSLHLPLSTSDPLVPAKEAILQAPPTVKLVDLEGEDEIAWISDAIWLVVTNMEDGLQFRVMQTTDGGRELKLFWNGKEDGDEDGDEDTDEDGVMVEDIRDLRSHIENSPLWEVFHLRAVVTLEQVVDDALVSLNYSEDIANTIGEAAKLTTREAETGEVKHIHQGEEVRESVVALAKELRERERMLLKKALRWLAKEKERLADTQVVRRYLESMALHENPGKDWKEEEAEDEDLS